MPDVTMCGSEKCPKATRCYYNPRSGTQPDKYRQSFFVLGQERSPSETDDCHYFRERTPLMAAAHDETMP